MRRGGPGVIHFLAGFSEQRVYAHRLALHHQRVPVLRRLRRGPEHKAFGLRGTRIELVSAEGGHERRGCHGVLASAHRAISGENQPVARVRRRAAVGGVRDGLVPKNFHQIGQISTRAIGVQGDGITGQHGALGAAASGELAEQVATTLFGERGLIEPAHQLLKSNSSRRPRLTIRMRCSRDVHLQQLL